jgi:hypothetical protein
MLRKTLLACGILSSILYVAMVVLIGARWDSYSWTSQTISELSAIGAPTRQPWVIAGALYTVLITAFGWGVCQSAGSRVNLHRAGEVIVVYGSLGLLWPLAPMHAREVLAAGGGTASDTMHLVLASVTVCLMLVAMLLATMAFDTRFRWFSIVSLVVLCLFGALTFLDAPRVGENLPTPWLGVWERINVGVFLLWVTALAVSLVKMPVARPAATAVQL